ncbi:MAG: LruC domain-containing protein [Planctomycetota bacterium]
MNKILLPLLGLALSAPVTGQDFQISVPNSVLSTIGTILPESSNAGAAYVSESFDANITVEEDCTVRVVFIHEGAGYQNSLGYFTYTENLDGSITIDSSDLLIVNASMPNAVSPGDGFELKDAAGDTRVFSAGENIGFFLISDGNRRASSLVQGWTFNQTDSFGTVPSAVPSENRQRGRGLYTSLAELNPENQFNAFDKTRHLALIWLDGVAGFLDGEDFLLVGFEDLRRDLNSDEDFNDLVFLVDADPLEAIDETEAFVYVPGDADSDGVPGTNDAFPNDPDRAVVTRTPTVGRTVLAFEDQYPSVGDEDYNDVVVAYVYEVITNADGDVKDIFATFSLIARGASYDHSFGVHFPGLPANATGTIDLEVFTSGSTTSEMMPQRTIQDLIANGNRRIDDVFDSTMTRLPPPQGNNFTNTLFDPAIQPGADARLHIEFTTPVDPAVLGAAPYDPFIFVDNPFFPNDRIDIHLTGQSSFADRPSYLPTESGAFSFVDENGFPWALEVPNNFRYPLETVGIELGYPQFGAWASSGGSTNQSWFNSPDTSQGRVSVPLNEIIPNREFAIELPAR